MLTKPPAIIQGPDGIMDMAKYSKRAVLEVFERIGGVDRLAEVADDEPKWFFEKLFGKTIQPEKIEITRERTVAELLAELDEKMVNVTSGGKFVIDADQE